MSEFPLTVADGAVLLILFLSAILAFARGFIHEVLSVGAWVGAAAAVVFGLPLVRPTALAVIDEPLLADLAGGVVIFVVALILLSILTRYLAAAAGRLGLNAVDRSLGFVFGLARGALIVCLGYLAVTWLVPKEEQPVWLREAKTRPLVERGAVFLKDLVPRDEDASRIGQRSRSEIERVLESERLARDIMRPEPKSPSNPVGAVEQGYRARERMDLERLLEGNVDSGRARQ